MTREEVIRILKEIEIPMNGDNEQERTEALNLAISALSADPCECVTKNNVITTICQYGTSCERAGKVMMSMCEVKQDLVDLIEELPGVPPKRPKGEWIVDKERLGYFISECSNCHWIGHGNEVLIYKPNFCPNCGVDMRGKT